MNERPTFSPFWHRVRMMKPRLRPHVQITRQHYRGRRWHVVHDPTSNQFYRLNPIAHDFVGMLDGERDVESAWKASLEKFGDSAPTQNEIIQLIGQLYNSNLLSCDASPETEQLLRRGRDRLKRKATAQAIGIMYFKIRAFNPDRILTACEPVLRPILNRWGFLAWCALIVWALATILPHWEKLTTAFNESHLFSAENLWLIPAAFIITKAIHEFGHGVVCKRFGGQVPEFGFMLLVFFPSPYVDASAAWAFPSKWQRIAVGGAGMMFELFVAAIAAFTWVSLSNQGLDSSTLAKLCYNIMLSSSVSTVLFNANPLMRFDGYYMLSDLLETPNLAQRANKMLMHLIQKYVYRLRNLTAPTNLPGERAILIIYGILAMAYRVFLFISITLFVLGQFFGLGLVLAVWTAAAWFILPIGKFIHWLATSPQHSEHRLRAVGISAGLLAAAVIIFGVIPMPDRRRGTGIVESIDKSTLHFQTEGFIAQVHVRPGQHVRAGETLVTLENYELQERKRSIQSKIDEFAIQERAALNQGDPAVAGLAAERVRVMHENLKEIERKIGELTVKSPQDGVIGAGDPERAIGGFVKKGDPVFQIIDPTKVRVAATLDQLQAGWLFDPSNPDRPHECEIRLISNVNEILTAERFDPPSAGARLLPGAALGLTGGGAFETEAKDESGRTAKRPQFNVYVYANDPAQLASLASPGERVKVRFKLEPRPLLSQWLERLSKEIQGRVHL